MTEAIGAIAISCIVGLVIGYFFNRWNREYVTTTKCDTLRDGCVNAREKNDADLAEKKAVDDQKFTEFKKEMREGMGVIKGLLLVIASGGKVSTEDLKELLK